MCDATQLPPDRLVLSITGVGIQGTCRGTFHTANGARTLCKAHSIAMLYPHQMQLVPATNNLSISFAWPANMLTLGLFWCGLSLKPHSELLQCCLTPDKPNT